MKSTEIKEIIDKLLKTATNLKETKHWNGSYPQDLSYSELDELGFDLSQWSDEFDSFFDDLRSFQREFDRTYQPEPIAAGNTGKLF